MFDYDNALDDAARALALVDEGDVLDRGWRERLLSDDDSAWLQEVDDVGRRSPDEVARAGERDPVSPGLVVALADIDARQVNADTRVALAVAWDRVRNYATAQLAHVVAADVEASSDVSAADGKVVIEAERLTSAELGAALRLGTGAADRLVDVSVALRGRLEETLSSMRRGDVSWAKATSLADATATLTDKQAREVEQAVLPAAPARIPSRHRDAVRRAVDRIDPAGAAERHRKARADVVLIRTHYGDGMGELFARMPSEELDVVWTAADQWARRRKAAGDERTLEHLRVAALVEWATSFLTAGTVASAAPRRHGRETGVSVLCSLGAILGVTETVGEMADSAATVSGEHVRELVARGGRLRRLLVDATTGELVDLTPRAWSLPTTTPSPFTFDVVIDTADHAMLTTGDVTTTDPHRLPTLTDIATAIDAAPEPLRATLRSLLDHPVTAPQLDATPAAYPTPARLAQFVVTRDRHPVTPTGGSSAASAADVDHTTSVAAGGTTTRDQLASLTRRWHVLKTHLAWMYRRDGRGWVWTSPAGRRYRTSPHDYRLGP